MNGWELLSISRRLSMSSEDITVLIMRNWRTQNASKPSCHHVIMPSCHLLRLADLTIQRNPCQSNVRAKYLCSAVLSTWRPQWSRPQLHGWLRREWLPRWLLEWTRVPPCRLSMLAKNCSMKSTPQSMCRLKINRVRSVSHLTCQRSLIN